MGTVLFAMGGYGTFLGWYMRANPTEKMALAPGPALGKTAVRSVCVQGRALYAPALLVLRMQTRGAKAGRQYD